MRHFRTRAYPITEFGSYNTHVRIRIFFNVLPDVPCVASCRKAEKKKKNDCAEGKYDGKKYPNFHFTTYFIPARKVFQVDFDFLAVGDRAIDGLLETLDEHLFYHGGDCRIQRVVVCYGLV